MDKVELIDRIALLEKLPQICDELNGCAAPYNFDEHCMGCEVYMLHTLLAEAPTIHAAPMKPTAVEIAVTHTELTHLISDAIAYTWKLEDRGIADEAHGYNSRKALLAKLQEIEREKFPENSVMGG